ncbi:MAG: hypothetical protein PHY92_00655 [Alphaproteobacteria bacterium]|nr:hypothetical protein [Alphaproteobacteria bacterium]
MTKTIHVTLDDLLLYNRFNTFKYGKLAQEKFVYFSKLPEEEGNNVYAAINQVLRSGNLQVSVTDSAKATDYKALHHFGVISDAAHDAAHKVFCAHGRVLKHEEKLMTYSMRSSEVLSEADFTPNSPDILFITAVLEQGAKRSLADVRADLFDIKDHIKLGGKLDPEGVKELITIGKEAALLIKSLPTEEKVEQMPMTNRMLLAAVDTLKRHLRLTESNMKELLSPQARLRIALLSGSTEAGQQAPRP